MSLKFFNASHIPDELYLSSRISAEEYLIAIKKIAIFGGFFMVVGFVLVDYFLLPRLFRESYEAFGVYWSAPIAIVVSYLHFLVRSRKAKRIIDKKELKSTAQNNHNTV